jgi:carbon monoxide dehydrogenase subunit G
MLLNNEFIVDVPVDVVWELLLDLERVIPCMPGAELLGREGEDVHGSLQIKVGPIGANFSGAARFVSVDEGDRSALISAAGNDPRGRTSAKAMINVRLEPLGHRTQVYVDTDLTLTGKLAQFGRGAIMDISTKMIGQFTDNLQAQMVRAHDGTAAKLPAGRLGTQGNSLGAQELATLVGPMLLKRVAIPVGITVAVWLVWRHRG